MPPPSPLRAIIFAIAIICLLFAIIAMP